MTISGSIFCFGFGLGLGLAGLSSSTSIASSSFFAFGLGFGLGLGAAFLAGLSSSLSSASLSSEPFDFFAAFLGLVGAAFVLPLALSLGESLPEPDLAPASESESDEEVGEPPSDDEAWKSSSTRQLVYVTRRAN